MNKIPIISVVSKNSNEGKTTLIEALVKELTIRGYDIATVKFSSCASSIDVEGKDTWRHSKAGAVSTAMIGPEGYAISRRTKERESIYNILDNIGQAHLIIAEGFRNLREPTIEVFRRDVSEGLYCNLEDLIAVATDAADLETSVPKFSTNDIKEICDFIEFNIIR